MTAGEPIAVGFAGAWRVVCSHLKLSYHFELALGTLEEIKNSLGG
jgi:hypothetical protein